ncbi:serine/threonine protein kinase [Tolypothrix sp. FACHB-123]|uniref:serine/threonine protein kinase n=1 Tax=Tolypothrix sp. FACHB-123 TaxID=2692868 RepID=UPI001685120D|nr:serine/threonine-protein kinase [Tolypothrix sp. FACHB-123]MBD2353502.1 serine/threonine protein kinase [Tolypothrix sp. FACHB-123]
MELDVRNGYQGKIPFNKYPDFSQHGYQVLQELGRNREAGRTTYLAYVLKTNQKVVIKEFRFPHAIADLSGVKAYEREIQMLQQLNHSRIPRYLDYFETAGNFYMLQEYKNALSLGLQRKFAPEEIKQIAISLLEILIYLQQRVNPIIHRDIKPENILVDEKLNAYLVDFGLAQNQGEKMTLSSLAAGTPGFMSPEEIFGYSLTAASDLYSLGVTLICLLTRTSAGDIHKLIDAQYRWKFQQKLSPQISPYFKAWLMKMVAHKRQHRYTNAATALAALKPIAVIGNGTVLETFMAAVKSRKKGFVLGLATLGTLAVAGKNLAIAQSAVINEQVLEASDNHSLQSNFHRQQKTQP